MVKSKKSTKSLHHTVQSVTLLIDCYWRVWVTTPNSQGGRAGENFEFILNSVSLQIPGLPGCRVLPSVVLHVVITWWAKSSDRSCSVLFPAKYKTEFQFRLGIILTLKNYRESKNEHRFDVHKKHLPKRKFEIKIFDFKASK